MAAVVEDNRYTSGTRFWLVKCDECLAVCNSGHHYRWRSNALAEAERHNARAHDGMVNTGETCG